MHGESPDSTHERVTVAEAAVALGISEHAVRARLSRGTLYSEKDDHDGRVYVYIPAHHDASHGGSHVASHGEESGKDALLRERAERIESLEAQLSAAEARDRESRRLLAAALERIPAIEAPEPGDSAPSGHERPAEGSTPSSAQSGPETGAQRGPSARSWIRRFFQRR